MAANNERKTTRMTWRFPPGLAARLKAVYPRRGEAARVIRDLVTRHLERIERRHRGTAA